MSAILRSLVLRAHRDLHVQRFLAAAGAHAADRRRGEIVAPDREPAMALAREHAVRDVGTAKASGERSCAPGAAGGASISTLPATTARIASCGAVITRVWATLP